MSLLKTSKAKSPAQSEPTWEIFHDDGSETNEILIAPWTRFAENEIERRLRDKDFVKSLNIDWDEMPNSSGDRRVELRVIVTADYLIRGLHNVESRDGSKVYRKTDDGVVDLYTKAWLFESVEVAQFVMAKARSGGVSVVENDAKN